MQISGRAMGTKSLSYICQDNKPSLLANSPETLYNVPNGILFLPAMVGMTRARVGYPPIPRASPTLLFTLIQNSSDIFSQQMKIGQNQIRNNVNFLCDA